MYRIFLKNMISSSCYNSWFCSSALNHVQGRFDHPYISFLFYGMDSAGDLIPIKQLREKYNRPRYEVPIDPEDEEPHGDA